MQKFTGMILLHALALAGCGSPVDAPALQMDVAELQATESSMDGKLVVLRDACLVANRHGLTAEMCDPEGRVYLPLIFRDDFPQHDRQSVYSAATQAFVRKRVRLRGDVCGIYRRSGGRPIGGLIVIGISAGGDDFGQGSACGR